MPQNKQNSNHSSQKYLLDAIESVAVSAKGSKLDNRFFVSRKSELNFLAKSYSITQLQAALFCVCMERGAHRIYFDDLALYLDLSTIRILGYSTDIDALVRRRLLCYCDAKEKDTFEIPTVVINSLKRNEVYQLPKRAGLDTAGMMEYLCTWFNNLGKNRVSASEVREELDAMIDENQQLPFAQRIKALGIAGLQTELLFFCHKLVNFCLMKQTLLLAFVNKEQIMPLIKWKTPSRILSCRRWKPLTAFSLPPPTLPKTSTLRLSVVFSIKYTLKSLTHRCAARYCTR